MNHLPPDFIKRRAGSGGPTAIEATPTPLGFFQTVPSGARGSLQPNLPFRESRPGVVRSFEGGSEAATGSAFR